MSQQKPDLKTLVDCKTRGDKPAADELNELCVCLFDMNDIHLRKAANPHNLEAETKTFFSLKNHFNDESLSS